MLVFAIPITTFAQSWEYVGAPQFSSGALGDIKVSSTGEPYVVDLNPDNFNLSVRTFDGNTWNALGNTDFYDVAGVTIPTLALSETDVPYVAFRDINYNAVSVLSYNGFSWDSLGILGFTPTTTNPAIAIFNEIPFIAISDETYGGKVTVKIFDGVDWISLGPEGFSANATVSASNTLQIAFSNSNVLHVAYIDEITNSINVMRFNANTVQWELVGSPNFSGPSSFLDLAIDGETPYVSFSDGSEADKASCMRYNGTAWEYVGPQGFTPADVDVTQLVIDDSTPFLAYLDGANNDNITVKKWDGSTWTSVGMEGFTPNGVLTNIPFSMSSYGGTPYVLFYEFGSSLGNSVMNFATSYTFDGPTGVLVDSTFGPPCVSNEFVVNVSGLNGTSAFLKSVNFDVTHSWTADLNISLTSPSGTTINLSSDNGGEFNDYTNTTFTDFGIDGAITNAAAPFTGSFSPEELLSTFAGECLDGDWILSVCDDQAGDVGTLNAWSLTFVAEPENGFEGATGPLEDNTDGPPCASNEFVVTVSGVGGITGSLERVNMDITHTFTGDLDISLTSPSGTTINLSYDNGGSGQDYMNTIFTDNGLDGLITAAAAPFNGCYIPEQALSTFDGETLDGDWILSVCDDAVNDVGTLNSWSLVFDKIDSDLFITTWETTTANESITVPTFGDLNGYTINWGDGTIETGQTGPATHTYTTSGIHTVSVNGDLTNISFLNAGNNDKIRSVEQWGNIEWTTFAHAFRGCTDLVFNAVDVPDLTNVSSMERAFQDCTNFNGDLSSWDVSNVMDMRYVFLNATSFNQPMNSWDVSNAIDMEGMFSSAHSFNQPLDSWEVSNVESMQFMFNSTFSFNQPLNTWDVSSVTDMSTMFFNNQVFNQPLNMWDVSNVTNMGDMLRQATAFDQNLGDWNLESLSIANFMIALSGLSIQNYDSTLIGWANGSSIPTNLSMLPAGLQYCMGEAARTSLMNDYNWSIIGDTNGCMTLTCPPDTTEAPCQTQTAIDAAFSNWLATAVVSNGCNPTVTNNATNAPDAATGGTVMVTFTATDECSPALTCTATFTVEASLLDAVITPSNTQLDCNTLNATLDASESINASGVLGIGLTYSWSNGGTNASTTVMMPGVYTVTITDTQYGCTDTQSVTITQDINPPTAQILSFGDAITCYSDFLLLDASSSSSQNGLTYLWTDGSMGDTLEVMAAGTYGLTVTDIVNGCIDTISVNILDNSDFDPSAMISANTTQLDCLNPDILLQGSGITFGGGGSGGSSLFSWSTGSFASSITVSTPGDYGLTVTDINTGCTSETSITITENTTPPIAEITSLSTQLDCINSSILLETFNSFGQGGLTYLWTGGSTDSTLLVSTVGNYFVTITDTENGCTAVDNITITSDGNIPTAVLDSPTTQLNCTIGSILLDASGSTSQNSFTYLWTGGSTSATLSVTMPGDYGVTITDSGNGCTASSTVTITENTTPPTAQLTAATTAISCSTTSITLDASTSSGQGALSYLWTGGSTAATLSVTTAGNYSVTVTDAANGCTSTDAITITGNTTAPTAQITAPSTQLDCSITSITLDATGSSGQGALTYLWTGGSTNATLAVSSAGTYSVTVTDSSNGCTAVDNITITSDGNIPTAEIATATIELNCNTSSLTLDASGSTGQNALTYLWSNNSPTTSININTSGTYSVTVTDSQNGCTSVASITITEDFNFPVADISSGFTQLDCANANILLDASGSVSQNGADYEWSDGSTGSSLMVSTANTYLVTITDSSNGCTDVASITITEDFANPTAVINSPGTQLDCTTSSISLDASSSTSQNGLTYSWTGGSTANTLVVTTAGTYSVTVTDVQNSCTDIASITISQDGGIPTALITSSENQIDCNTSSITLSATGSTGQNMLSYLWTGGSTDPIINVSTAGDYSVTVTDAGNGCTGVDVVTITENFTEPTAIIDAPVTQLDCISGTLNLDASASTGQSGLTYLWSTGSTSALISVGAAGDYSVTVTDVGNACNNVATVTITQDGNVPTATINASATQLDCSTANITLDASGSTSQNSLIYLWSDGSSNASLEVIAGGVYSLTVTDVINSCTSSAMVTIAEDNNIPTALIVPSDNQIDCNTSSITLDASGSTSQNGLTYNWTGGSTAPILTVSTGGVYSVTVTDVNNTCVSIEEVTILESLVAPVAIVDAPVTQLSCNDPTITLDASASTGQSGLTYLWTGGSTNASLSVSVAGTYSVTITDVGNACTDINTVTITGNTILPTAQITAPLTQLDCDNTSILLDASASTGQGGLTYLWTDGSAAPTLTVTTAGLYSVTVTDSQNSCTAVDMISITQDGNIPTATITSSVTQLDCDNVSILLDASASTSQNGITYLWSDGSTSPSLLVTVAGTYGVTITDVVNACTAIDVVTITENTILPTAQIAPLVTTLLTCNLSTVTLDASGSVGQGTLNYLWTGGATTATLDVSSGGTYGVTITDTQNGCTATSSIIMEENLVAPTAVITADPTTVIDCIVTEITLDGSASTGQGGLSFVWTGGLTGPVVTVDVAGVYTLTVTDEVNGCTNSTSITITDNLPLVTTTSNAPLCLGEDLQLTSNAAAQWNWQGPNGFGSTQQNPTIDNIGLNGNGTYFVTITDVSGCSSEGSIDVTINALPAINITGTEVVCAEETISLAEDGEDATQWDWSGPNNFDDNQENITITTASDLNGGQYMLTITDANGCTAEDQIEVVVNPLPILNIASTGPICDGEDLGLTETGGDAVTWEWSTPDGEVYNTTDVFIEGGQAVGGIYQLLATNAEGCMATEEIEVLVLDGALIESNFLVGESACTGDTLRLIEHSFLDSLGAVSFLWDFGNGDSSTDRDPSYIYTDAGIYNVNLQVLSGDCPNISIDKMVGVFECLQFEEGQIYATLTPTLNDGTFELTAQLEEYYLLLTTYYFGMKFFVLATSMEIKYRRNGVDLSALVCISCL